MSKKKADKPNRGSAPADQRVPRRNAQNVFMVLKLKGLPKGDKQFDSEGFKK
jgi:hypothetical protein